MKTGEEVNYNTDKVKLISSKAKQNNQWKLLSASSTVNLGKYEAAPNETFPSIVFSYYIERHSAYHVNGTIVPAIILLICNLTALWLLPGCIERFVLCIFNLFTHFLYIEFLYWMLPFSGDSIPTALIFFRDSQVIATFLVVECLIVKTLVSKEGQRPYLWIQSIVSYTTTSMIGETFFLTPTSEKIEDVADLVESVKKHSSDQTIWMIFCKLIDRVLFLSLLFLYVFMFITLLPEGFLAVKYDSIEALS